MTMLQVQVAEPVARLGFTLYTAQVSKETVSKGGMALPNSGNHPTPMSSSTQGNSKEERIERILDAALEVFSEFSFVDATTGEIAKRARVSKRDIYAYFPNKQALLMGIVVREMQRQDETFRQLIQRLEKLRSLRSKLEGIGLALVEEILSPRMGVVRRLVVSESINQPFLGDLFFEGGVAQRCKLITEVLASHQKKKAAVKVATPDRAAQRYLSSIAYFPSTMIEIGLRAEWSDPVCKAHVVGETEVFLKAHPSFV